MYVFSVLNIGSTRVDSCTIYISFIEYEFRHLFSSICWIEVSESDEEELFLHFLLILLVSPKLKSALLQCAYFIFQNDISGCTEFKFSTTLIILYF